MTIYDKPVRKDTPEQREKALRETLEEIWIQGKDFTKHSASGRASHKALKTLKQLYGEEAYERIG